MKKTFLVLSLLILVIPLFAQEAAPKGFQNNNEIHLNDFHGPYLELYSELKIFHDKNGNAVFEEVQKNDQIFILNNTKEIFHHDDVYWAKLLLYGHTEKTDDYLFRFSADELGQSWGNIDAWLVHADSTVVHQKSGNNLKKEIKSIPSTLNLARFEIGKNEKATLYVRLKGVEKNK